MLSPQTKSIKSSQSKESNNKRSRVKTIKRAVLPSSSASSSTDFSSSTSLVTGSIGNWESLHGNWVLRPGGNNDEPPRAVIHFLGGALVGAAPQITYRYLLEKLADKGFLIVATPYNLSFDHLATCDEVLTKFEDLAPALARQYGALPVVGIGHSCGALLHLLITCLFPDTPRAANALLSFNNKPVTEAVPFFEEFFVPVFTSIAAPTMVEADGTRAEGPSSNDSLVVGLKLAMAATQGQLPSDELLQEWKRVFRPSLLPLPGFPLPIPSIPTPPFFPFNTDNIQIPTEIRETYQQWVAPSISQLKDAGISPLLHETIVSLEQIPKLVDEVSRGYTNGVSL
jgi:acetyl esterase/lipase